MSKWVVDIRGDIEGDYEIIKEYEEPKAGKWVDIPFSHYFKCSECDKYQISETNYCPNCGARMESKQNE